MKKIIPAFIIVLVSCSAMAQYKKATVFGKQGRTYEVGTMVHLLGTEQGTRPGIILGFGRDQDGQRLFYNWELEYVPSYSYTYQTTESYSSLPVTVSGTTKPILNYNLNYGYFLLKNDDAGKGVKPYLFAGLNMVLLGGVKDESTSPPNVYTAKETNWASFNSGIGGGAGCVVNVSEKLGIKLFAGYSKKLFFGAESYDQKPFTLFDSHPYGGVTLRFRIVSE